MATRLSESRIDRNGESLPEGVYALVNPQGEVVSYKARWREQDENDVSRQRSKSDSPREFGSLDKARTAAIEHRECAVEIVKSGDRVLRSELGALGSDPGIIVRFHEDLQQAKLAISARRASLALLRSVLRWGRRRYPRTLTADVAASSRSRASSAGASSGPPIRSPSSGSSRRS
jgi:hypothetical protein